MRSISNSFCLTESILFMARMTGIFSSLNFLRRSFSASRSSPEGSTTKRHASTPEMLSLTAFIIFSPSFVRGRWKPGVSVKTS